MIKIVDIGSLCVDDHRLNALSSHFPLSRSHTLMLEEASVITKSVSKCCSHSNDVILLGRQSPTKQNCSFLSLAKVYHQVTMNYANFMQSVIIRLKSSVQWSKEQDSALLVVEFELFMMICTSHSVKIFV